MAKRISKYWKYQLLGWGANGLISLGGISYTPDFKGGFFWGMKYLSLTMVVGILFSHLMRVYIKRRKLTEKPFRKLILPVSALTIFFGFFVGFFILNYNIETGINLWKRSSWQENYFLFIKEVLNGSILLTIWVIIYFFYQYQKRNKKQEQEKANLKLQAAELEARALRAQMNPHFIFNCMNSIKSLIQQHEEEKSVSYLTTFSKLIRTLFNNADKKEISLYDEIETCKLYLQLEAMRFDTKFSYAVKVDENLDLKSVQVPALIIQPFIENAIWHGIVPKREGGHVELAVTKKDNAVEISINDNGIGRESSKQNKSVSSLTHQSKGVNLTQSRLELDNLLRQRMAKLETIDKKDEKGLASGTKIIITIKEELS